MKVTLTQPTRVNALAGTVEVDAVEAARLLLLNVAKPCEEEKKPAKKATKKK